MHATRHPPETTARTASLSPATVAEIQTLARPVFDGGKPDSKRHTCSARCTSATGPCPVV